MRHRIGIDVGGTFTDFLLVNELGDFEIYKKPTTPSDPAIGVFEGLQAMADDTGLSLAEFLESVDLIVHGTTVTTNALLTRSGAKTALLTTAGFRDALEMRRGIREEQFDNNFAAPAPLVRRKLRIGLSERVTAGGEVLKTVDRTELEEVIRAIQEQDVGAVAVCLLHSYANPENERLVGEYVRETAPHLYVTVSDELLPAVRFYDRVSTTVLNSYVGPILSRYLSALTQRLTEHSFHGTLLIMQSNGGVTSPSDASKRAAVTLLSGPAAGPVAGIAYGEQEDAHDTITVDMGGTSFDVSLVRGATPLMMTEGTIDRLRCGLPMVAIHTIGAGGGSIAYVDDMGLLRVGPESAGANPGPACYSLGGDRPTVTDADVVLGYLNPGYFLGGAMTLSGEAAQAAIARELSAPLGVSDIEAAAGIYRIVNAHMADGIREVSVKRGYDPREFVLVVAGGAGPVHAAVLADELEMRRILIPRESSVFCATGMLLSDLRHDYVQSINHSIAADDSSALEPTYKAACALIDTGATQLESEGIPGERITHLLNLDVRYRGQYHEISVPVELDTLAGKGHYTIAERFGLSHDQAYGYSLQPDWLAGDAQIEIINVRCTSIGVTRKPHVQVRSVTCRGREAVRERRPVYNSFTGEMEPTEVWDGHALSEGYTLEGPAVVELATTTIVVPQNFTLRCDTNFLLTRT
jgi:N-methylhydantoinase A